MRWVAVLVVCLLAATASAQPDWGVKRDPFDASVVGRYKAILSRDPHDEAALRELVTMYQRYRTLAKLEAEYRKQLDGGEDWAALVVLARLPKLASGDAMALWKRAVAAKPDDPRAWIAIGDAAKSDAAVARDAYQRAVQLATVPKQKKAALTKLVGAARTAGDAATVDSAYAELIAMSPKDGNLWLDRGNAQLSAKRFDAAKTSFEAAEPLLRTDPERRLTAIMNQGIALESLGKADEAIAQYERALDGTPRGFFLANDLVARIVETERKRKRLDAAVERLEKRWPERTRGHFEWSTLGDLYKQTAGEDKAIDAYKRAVAKAPTEVATQRKLITLLDKTRSAEALVQHETAARYAPGDADLQLELAKRYRAAQPEKAFKTLEALARRHSRNINVRNAIAALYEQWNEPLRAIGEYEAVVAAEPDDPDHAIVLGDAYWRANQHPKAKTAWQHLDKIGTAEAFFRHGEVLANHDMWPEAAEAYTKSVALDGANADVLYGRARTYEALGRVNEAVEDARRAVALTGNASHGDGLRNRNLLVRVLGKAYDQGDQMTLSTSVTRWRFAFERGDTTAGYLLAAHHGRIRSHQHHDVLVQLYRQAPNDDSLGIALARSYMHRREYSRARTELEKIGKRNPKRAEDIAKLLEQNEEERDRAEREIRWEEEGRSKSRGANERPDLVGRHRRVGMRFMIGSDVDNTSGAFMGIGLYRTHHLARGTSFAWRLDWGQHDGDNLQEHRSVEFGGAFATRLIDARKFEIAVGAGPRFELRYGRGIPTMNHDRVALGGDITLEALPRAIPATLGLRFHHSLTDPPRSSALLVELGFEVR